MGLLRNTKNERVFTEDCLAQAAQLAHPGATEDQICNLDGVNAFRIGSETKLLKEFRREEAAIGRLINASLRELNMLRKLNPMPKSPVRPHTEYLGPDAGPVDHLFRDETSEPEENTQEVAPATSERSQRETGWSPVQQRPAKPLVRTVGSSVET